MDTTPLKVADFPTASPVDQARADEWQSKRAEAGAAAQALAQRRFAIRTAQRPTETVDWFAEYSEYLQTDAWQAARSLVLKRDQGRCTAVLAGCTRVAEQVHHAFGYRYHRRLNETPLFMLKSVCKSCHDALTEADRADRVEKK